MAKLEFIKNLTSIDDLVVNAICKNYNAELKINEIYELLEKYLTMNWAARLKVQGEGNIYNTLYKCKIYVDNTLVGILEKRPDGKYTALK